MLALAYFGAPGLPATLQRVPLEVGLDAADWLLARPEVEGPRLGLVGTSRGGELALLLAATRPAPFAAVVANAGSDVVFPAGPVGPAASTSSWTLGGRDVPFIPALNPPPSLPVPGHPFRAAPVYAAATTQASPGEFEAARIPVERITAPLLFTSGGDDGLSPAPDAGRRIEHRLAAAGNRFGSRWLNFPAAGHLIFTPPGVPAPSDTIASGGGVELETGGTPGADAQASAQTWSAAVDLLDQALP